MTVKEAYDLIDAVRGMFSAIYDETENGDEGEGFLDTPVHVSTEPVYVLNGGGLEYDTRFAKAIETKLPELAKRIRKL